jgi:DNA-binding NarL/FixJ family response regulator
MSARRGILIVDDEAILLLAIRQELRLALGSEYVYETAFSAERGLDAIDELSSKEVEVAVIVSDWLMPGMRGDEFLRRVHAERPEARLVMLSGHADDDQMESLSRELGLFAYMSKPYGRNELAEVVRRALRDGPAAGCAAQGGPLYRA